MERARWANCLFACSGSKSPGWLGRLSLFSGGESRRLFSSPASALGLCEEGEDLLFCLLPQGTALLLILSRLTPSFSFSLTLGLSSLGRPRQDEGPGWFLLLLLLMLPLPLPVAEHDGGGGGGGGRHCAWPWSPRGCWQRVGTAAVVASGNLQGGWG